jgi:pimeloyl-ACP methyl ester carboxylesterase
VKFTCHSTSLEFKAMRLKSLGGLFVLLTLVSPLWSMTPDERREYLGKLLQTLPEAPAFQQWLSTSGRLPPDFDALPRSNDLPDPLRFLDGRPVRTQDEWNARKQEIKRLFEQYALGTFPPHPKLERVVTIDETNGPGYRLRHVRLVFGPESKGTLRVELFIPDGPGPFPVFMGTPWARPWAQQALRRKYLCALYAASDGQDDADALAALYPEYDFALLPRRAWAGTMTLDYLATLKEADMRRVGLTGHSRDGKQVLIEAGLDDRITAVIASSTGVGGTLPYRLAGEYGMGEGIETTTRRFPTWFHPSLRFFAGREDRLPVDGNLLVALVAPRACMIAFGINDSVSNPWADEQSYLSALKVYRLLGHPERLSIYHHPGFHATTANDIEAYLDWFDIQFGRSKRSWDCRPLYGYDFDRWRADSQENVDPARYPRRSIDDILTIPEGGTVSSKADWEKKVAEIRKSVQWMLGDEPPKMSGMPGMFPARPAPGRAGGNATAPRTPPANPQQTAPVLPLVAMQSGASMGWPKPDQELAAFQLGMRFGYNVAGDLYYPASAPADAKLPVVIWLHGYGYAMGYEWSYRWDLSPILALVKAGYAVFAFDQIGFGSRIAEAGPFYDRWPHWSQFGRMVEDTRAAIDMLEKNNRVDPERIYLFGYSMGGTLGIYTAALDPRVKGVVSVCGFTPMRTDAADRGTGGIARFSHLHGLLPRLGFFIGNEARIPYDYHELLGTIAPRPVFILQPQLDRDATPADVRTAVDQARKIYALYDAAEKLRLDEPWDYNRLPNPTQDRITEWMKENMR